MAENGSPKFKIRFNDEGAFDSKIPEPPLREEIENLRLNQLDRKINTFAVLFTCLLIVIFGFGYLHIHKKFNNFQVLGSTDVQSLSKDLNSKFSSLSIRQAKIESLLDEKISAIEKNAARLEKNLEASEKTLHRDPSIPPGKEQAAGILAEVEKTLASIQTDVKKLAAEVKKVSSDAKLLQDQFDKDAGKLATGITGLQKDVGMLKADSVDLSSSRVDKKTFDLTVRHQEKFFQQKLNDLEKSLSEKIESLRNQITAFEDKPKKSSPGSASDAKKPVPTAPPPLENFKSAVPQPGKIIEQEIKK